MATAVNDTLKSSGGDYTLISTWEDDIPANLVTADEQWTLTCYDDWASGLEDSVTIAERTTDATRFIKVTVAEGERHTGVHNTGFYLHTSVSDNFLVDCQYTEIEYLDFYNTCTWASSIIYGIRTSKDYCKLSNIISTSAATTTNYVLLFALNFHPKVFNCLADATDYMPANASVVVGYHFYAHLTETYNCTAANMDYGYHQDISGTYCVYLYNCVAYGCTSSYVAANTSDWKAESTNNAASDAATNTPPGSNPITTDIDSDDFIDAANADFHIPSTSTLYAAGYDFSATFTYDIDGDTRIIWSVGMDELTSTLPVANDGSYSFNEDDTLQDNVLDNDFYTCS